ncbi:VOC family protein [Coraliomargarita akajimensis]|uniref:Glyoxalase/bleomycin resistance protein/dioxygenase n=1 Tax=Coraliomargarita akajimensis (strain DSM 45221 / IAM 15411 / JCM 23193 / KCTC 12865 / 04OKA010-24) TaxID=583355 RepID=D5EL80_CORAD|nr:glyoxalase superfamily protein [Coraliomargarita akajimensis]ADE53182.1 Glyoxalase/bleomycin resistance protein/dioxygenase [Coraliomargarita akajimensis DSM 45221]
MKIQRAAFIALPAADFDASRRFYGDLLGLPVHSEGEDGFSRYVHFDAGGFGFHIYEWTKPYSHAPHTGLQVYVTDVDALYAELKAAGVRFAGEVRDEPWGGRVVTVLDPDGNRFDLLNAAYAEQLKPVKA